MTRIDNVLLAKKFENNKKNLFFCMAITYIWGFIAHAYMFLDNSLSHDSLNEFYALIYGNDIRIAFGRIFVPAYRFFSRSAIAMPWLIGILALLYISLSVFLVCKIFRINSRLNQTLVAGIFTVNVTVIATTATYIHDLDCDMLALLFATAAVFCWNYSDKYGFLIGAPFVMLSLGIYQSYVSVTISLVIMYLIVEILKTEKFKTVMIKGLKAVAMIIIGGLLYIVAIKIITSATNISLAEGGSTSLDNIGEFSIGNAAGLIAKGIKNMFPMILLAKSIWPENLVMVVSVAIFVITIMLLLKGLLGKKVGIKEAVLAVLLVAMLPVGMNISFVLSNGRTHDVMLFSYWLMYFLILVINKFSYEKEVIVSNVQKVLSAVLAVGMTVILWGNVQTANAVYLKKDFEYDSNLSFFTRVVSRMEEHERYIPGETPVVFIGKPNKDYLIKSPAFENVNEFTGARSCYVPGVASWDYYRAYFDYILMNPAVMAEEDDWYSMRRNAFVKKMPAFPAEGSIEMVKGILVVKLG